MKYFGTDGIRSRVGGDILTPDFAVRLGWAFGQTLNRDADVVIGRDTRESSPMFESGLIAGLTYAGCNTVSIGIGPTPAVAHATLHSHSAGVMITASHNPYHDNGFKFFFGAGSKISKETMASIEHYLEKPMVMSTKIGLSKTDDSAIDQYGHFCKSLPTKQISQYKIVVDCANGAMSAVAIQVLNQLNANVVAINVSPNGTNINHHCGATDTTELQRLVPVLNADLGIAFDGDGDRCMMVDANGNVVDGDDILYIIASNSNNVDGVVGTIMSNMGTEKAFNHLNIPFYRADVGDHNVMEVLNTKGLMLGAEPSGHVLMPHVLPTGDALIAALKVLDIMNLTKSSLAELVAPVTKYHQLLDNIPVKDTTIINEPVVVECISSVQEQLGDGRYLVRPSGTEPVLRVMVESISRHRAQLALSNIMTTLREVNNT